MEQALATTTNLRNTAVTQGELIEHDSIFDRDSADELDSNHPEWCVDVGDELKAMNKFELWLALGTGDVAADARVWKVGRERWQAASEIPDLACALKLHAQVLLATIASAANEAEGDRVTLVPGRLPSLVTTSKTDFLDAEECRHDCSPEENEVSSMKAGLGSIESWASPPGSPPAPEVEAKSVTPGPAVVEVPDTVIVEPLIRQRRGLPRKQATSPWSAAAGLAALVATSLLTLPTVLSTSPSAASQVPTVEIALPMEAILAGSRPPSEATPKAPVTASSAEMSILPSPSVAPQSDPSSSSEGTTEAPVAHVSRPSKHHVRPTSVTPSHRGQDRKRQHSR